MFIGISLINLTVMNVRFINRGFELHSCVLPAMEHERNVRDEWSNVFIKLYDEDRSEVWNVRMRMKCIRFILPLRFFIQFQNLYFFTDSVCWCRHNLNRNWFCELFYSLHTDFTQILIVTRFYKSFFPCVCCGKSFAKGFTDQPN